MRQYGSNYWGSRYKTGMLTGSFLLASLVFFSTMTAGCGLPRNPFILDSTDVEITPSVTQIIPGNDQSISFSITVKTAESLAESNGISLYYVYRQSDFSGTETQEKIASELSSELLAVSQTVRIDDESPDESEADREFVLYRAINSLNVDSYPPTIPLDSLSVGDTVEFELSLEYSGGEGDVNLVLKEDGDSEHILERTEPFITNTDDFSLVLPYVNDEITSDPYYMYVFAVYYARTSDPEVDNKVAVTNAEYVGSAQF